MTNSPISKNHSRVIRVFVSSTFRDMHAERDHLVTVIFPELRERVERLGLELYDIDLRWGVPEKEKGAADGEKANSWAYCKQWIERVEPFFISLLGERYGWIPPETEIRDEKDRAAYHGMSITEMEIRYAVLSGQLQRCSFFYLRDTLVPKSAPLDIYKDFVDPNDQERLKSLKEEIVVYGQPVRHYDCHWTGAGFTDLDTFGKMVLEDLWSGVLRDERYVSKAAWQKVLGHDPQTDPRYTDKSQPLPPELCEKILEAAKPASRDPLQAEDKAMTAFAAGRLRWFHGREVEIRQLADFINDDPPAEASRVCVVHAIAGQGKSALLAKLADSLVDSSYLVITHFVGIGERGTDIRSLLERLDQELEQNGIPALTEEERKYDIESLRKRFAARLEDYNGLRRVVLIIDALNQLNDGHDLFWLPRKLGPNVRIILSNIDNPIATPESAEARVMASLQSLQPEPFSVNLKPLNKAEVRAIVQEYLVEYCKELDEAQIEIICQMEQARNPLYLLIMLNELRTLGGNDMNRFVPYLIAKMKEKYPDSVSLFAWTLERLEIFGVEKVRLWCTYLALGRVGMSSRELSDLLARKLGADAASTSLLIERGLRRYLQRRGPQLDFFHEQLREAVKRRYLNDLKTEQAGHLQLGEFFRQQADPLGNATWTGHLPRPLTELSFHLVRGDDYNAFKSIYTDSAYLEAVCFVCDVRFMPDGQANYAGVFGLLADLQDAHQFLKNNSEKVVIDLRRHLQAISDVLIDRGSLLQRYPQTISQELANYIEPTTKATINLHKNALKLAHKGLLVKEKILTEPSIPGHTAEITALATSPSGQYFLSGGRDGYIGCWQVDQPQPLWFIRAHKSEVTSVAFSPDGRQGLSTGDDGTVFLWEIDRGQRQQLFDEFGDTNKTVQWPYSFGVFLDNNSLFMIRNGTIKFEISTGRELWRNFEISNLVGRRHQCYIDFSLQAGVIAVGGDNSLFNTPEQIEIFDANQGKRLSTLKCPTPISRLALTCDASNLVAADSQGRLTAYETLSGKQVALTRTEPFFALCRAYTEQAFFAFDRLGKFHKITIGHELQIESHDSLDLTRLGPTPSVIACLPNNQTLVIGTNTGTLLLIDWESACVIRKWEPGKSLLTGSIFPNRKGAVGIRGSHIAGQPNAGYRLAFLEPSGRLVDVKDSPHSQRISGVVAIDSQRSLTVDKGGTAVIWKGHRAIKVHRGTVDFTTCAAWREAGIGVGGTQDDKIIILGEGEQVKEFYINGSNFALGSSSGIAALAISGKPISIFAVYFNGAIRFVREEKGWRTQGHQLMGSAAALTSKGHLAASGNINGEVRVWQCSTGDLTMEYFLHQGEVTALAFDPTGRFLYSAGADRFVYEINLEQKQITRATVLPSLPIALLVESNNWLSTLDLQGNVYRFLSY